MKNVNLRLWYPIQSFKHIEPHGLKIGSYHRIGRSMFRVIGHGSEGNAYIIHLESLDD